MSDKSYGQPKSKSEKERQEKIQRSRLASEYNNPCLKEHNLSNKCLNDNNYAADKCKAQFENYNTCKAFWNKVRSDRRSKGIRPYLPLPEDREKVKAEYIEQIRKNHSR